MLDGFQKEFLPCVAHVSVVLCWLFPHGPAEWLSPLSGPPLLCITKHLWCPEVQGEIYQAVYANQRAEIQKSKNRISLIQRTMTKISLNDLNTHMGL